MTGYDLSRQWFDFAFENSRRVKPLHTAIYFWAIEKANRLGWPEEFQLPTEESCLALGVKDQKTFRAALKELFEWGALRLVQQAASQNVARYVSLSGCQLSTNGCLGKVLENESRLSEKRTSEPLSDTPATTPSEPLSAPRNNKPQTTNHKPQTISADASAFDVFWDAYDKKVDRKKSEAKWKKLPEKSRQEILQNVPAYIQANADPEYRKNPLTYLNGECWKDPIVSGGRIVPLNGAPKKEMVY